MQLSLLSRNKQSFPNELLLLITPLSKTQLFSLVKNVFAFNKTFRVSPFKLYFYDHNIFHIQNLDLDKM